MGIFLVPKSQNVKMERGYNFVFSFEHFVFNGNVSTILMQLEYFKDKFTHTMITTSVREEVPSQKTNLDTTLMR